MSPQCMILTPSSTSAAPGPVRLGVLLGPLGFIGAPRPGGTASRYAPGARFAQLLCFLGCSPTLNADGPGGAGFIEIELCAGRIVIHGLAEGIALPSDELLAALAEETGTPWRCDYGPGPAAV